MSKIAVFLHELLSSKVVGLGPNSHAGLQLSKVACMSEKSA